MTFANGMDVGALGNAKSLHIWKHVSYNDECTERSLR